MKHIQIKTIFDFEAPLWLTIVVSIIIAVALIYGCVNIWNLFIKPVLDIRKRDDVDWKTAKATYDSETKEFLKKNSK